MVVKTSGFFFSDTITCMGHFTVARCKATMHGHAFVTFPAAALLLHLDQLCPWRTVGIKLASAEMDDLWRDYGETQPQKKLNSDLRVAGYGKCPVPGTPCNPACKCGTAGEAGQRRSKCGGAASYLTVVCLLLRAGPKCHERLLAMASKCPPRAGNGLWHCVAHK